MSFSFAHTLKNYDVKMLPADIRSGLIIAAVSIPISMGYAQIAGLPAAYGLYGSVFPILFFSLFSTSPQLIFGVDAAPAALVGSALLSLQINSGSEEALKLVPVITFLVASWLLLFSLMKAGKLVTYISAPVMGGFITGICTEIILMQVPKLMGGTPGTGELPELLEHIIESAGKINTVSLILGLGTLIILFTFKKIAPKFPMAVLLMAAGAVMTLFLPLKEKGVITLSAVTRGLPVWSLPELMLHADSGLPDVHLAELVTVSLSIAVVIMSETLLAENSFARKNGYRIDDNQELLAFALGNFAASFTGCCPINGSVSRTSMNEQYQGRTQMTGLIAGLAMAVLLLTGTGFIGYLPVPVLTAIVISALWGATEFDLAYRLWKVNRKECFIFFGACFGVLMLGTVNGVLVGILLSFAEVIIRSARPATCFLGIQPGHTHFRDLKESSQICPLEGVVIYRFSSNLFFANADILQREIEDSIGPDTGAVILDAGGISSIDITAADRLAMLYKSLKQQGIRFYMTEHIADVNEQLRSLGLSYMIEEGAVRRTIHIALKDMGIRRPYPLQGNVKNTERSAARKRADNRLQEYAWAFGKETEEAVERQIEIQIEKLKASKDIEELLHGSWSYREAMDEDEWLLHVEEHVKDLADISGQDENSLISFLEKNRDEIYQRILEENPEMEEQFRARRRFLNDQLKKKSPEIYELLQNMREDADNS